MTARLAHRSGSRVQIEHLNDSILMYIKQRAYTSSYHRKRGEL